MSEKLGQSNVNLLVVQIARRDKFFYVIVFEDRDITSHFNVSRFQNVDEQAILL